MQAQTLDGANTDTGFPDADPLQQRQHGDPRGRRAAAHADVPDVAGMGPNGGDVNGGDDASIIYHEYTHGLSSRLVTDNAGNPALGSQQSAAMGEGWSDWYAMDFLVNHGYDQDNAESATSTSASTSPAAPGFRTQPLDCPVGSTDDRLPQLQRRRQRRLHLRRLRQGHRRARGARGRRDLGPDALGSAPAAIAKYGAVAGDQRAETYITRGMELSPPYPSIIDMRNAILQAETVATAAGGPFAGTDDDDVLWQTFATAAWATSPARSTATTSPGRQLLAAAGTRRAARARSRARSRLERRRRPGGRHPRRIGGHNSGVPSDLAATTNASGTYTIANVPNGTYPYVFVGGHGLRPRRHVGNVDRSTAPPAQLPARRNWAQPRRRRHRRLVLARPT